MSQKNFAETEENDQAIPLSLQWTVWENKILDLGQRY